MGAEATILCPLEAKKSLNDARISIDVMPYFSNCAQKYGFIITFA
jgi:hypothetical protein